MVRVQALEAAREGGKPWLPKSYLSIVEMTLDIALAEIMCGRCIHTMPSTYYSNDNNLHQICCCTSVVPTVCVGMFLLINITASLESQQPFLH